MERRIEIINERRAKPRIECAFSAIVRGTNDNGSKFQKPATLSNLSACGLYLRIHSNVDPGPRLFVVFSLSTTLSSTGTGTRVAVLGQIVRTKSSPQGYCDVAVKFNRNRFLEA